MNGPNTVRNYQKPLVGGHISKTPSLKKHFLSLNLYNEIIF